MHRLKIIVLILISIFFTLMGVDLLISAYRLTDPFNFILMFFASNLMILISAALCLGFALQLKRSFSKDPQLKRSFSKDPQLKRSFSKDPQLKQSISRDPQLKRSLSPTPQDRAGSPPENNSQKNQ